MDLFLDNEFHCNYTGFIEGGIRMAVVSRYTVALHALTFMAVKMDEHGEYIPSDQIANSVGTSPVFIRRILGKLAKAHLVSVKHGGVDTGWKLARHPDQITLLDVYTAIVQRPLFELHHSTPSSECVIGRGIQPALESIYHNSQAALREQLAQYSISMLLTETFKRISITDA